MAIFLAAAALLAAVASSALWWNCRVRLTAARRHVRQLLSEKKNYFGFMHEIGEAFTGDVNQEQLLGMILDAVMRVTSARSGAIFLHQSQHRRLFPAMVRGLFPPPVPLGPEAWARALQGPEQLRAVLRDHPLPLDPPSPPAELFLHGGGLLLNGEEAGTFFPPSRDPEFTPYSLICLTLLYREETLGLLTIANPAPQDAFSQADFDLVQSIAAQAAFSLHHAAVYTQLAEKKQLDRDLLVAREIQQILLPARCPDISGYDLAAVNLPAKYVSGDYFDFIQVDEDRWGIVIADVSGKGVPASLVMAMCRSVLRLHARGCTSAAELLRRVNRVLFPDLRNDMFITMAYAILDTRKNEITLAKAGHDAPLFHQAGSSVVRLLQSPGMVLGIDSGDVFDMVIQDLVVPLQPGDTLLMHTDGVNEAVDEEGREFGRDPLLDSLRKCSKDGASALTVNIVERVARFRGTASQNDDITLLILQKK
ncbi:MAG: GAF domain-containing SpoIIE family protein phosphatase [Candidatus Methylacidiphilales bacterium]|nr:GAF domain-containing SpoIIE family protein phosphatase [Candidatus Methylacidiphilales bacterium]